MTAGRWLLVLALLLGGGIAARAADGPRRVALVIGNGAYTDVPKLANPASDAAAIGQALRDVGFTKVTVVTDLSHQGLFDALRTFSDESATADWSVLYYAGHGIEVGGKNYLVPIDAHLAFDRDVEFEAVPMQTVLAAVGGARHLRLVILDACREDPFLSRMRAAVSSRSITRGLARIEPQGRLFIVYSAQSGQVALDGEGGRSPFVQALLKNIETPGLEVNLVFRKVHDDVEQATNGEQEPATEGALPGEELYFKAPPSVAALEKPVSSPTIAPQPPVAAPPPVVVPPPFVAAAPPSERIITIEGAPKPTPPPEIKAEIKAVPPVVTAKLEPPPPTSAADAAVTALAVQNELRRVGCDAGPANGQWTVRSRMALLEFSAHVNLTLDVDKPDGAALDALRGQRGVVCPPKTQAKTRPPSQPKRASLEPEPPRHVAPPPHRPAPPHVVQRVERPTYATPAPRHPASPRSTGASCFSFNGERVCE